MARIHASGSALLHVQLIALWPSAVAGVTVESPALEAFWTLDQPRLPVPLEPRKFSGVHVDGAEILPIWLS
ncbi:MAG TPA: hypothetical protein VE733_02595 [Streptosporangiaceae bacterium]|jgi:hypothetical protein|nr:hypothetical protein [Streptosporangiaceae bacterium]